MCHHELDRPKCKQLVQELLRINKCVQQYLYGINFYFCASLSWAFSLVFNCAFMEISWAIRSFMTYEIHARL